MKKYESDKINDVKETSLIQLSRDLLTNVVDSTGMLEPQTMTPEKVREARLVLGFLNAANNAIKTKLQVFKLLGVEDKIKAIEDHKTV